MITRMDQAYLIRAEVEAGQSQDPSRKTGCFIVGPRVSAGGYNCFPTGVAVTPERMQRPAKYVFTEHAERNAIYYAAKYGDKLEGCTAYLNWYPCADCARALVQVGIARLVCYEPNWNETQYGFVDARAILEEGGVIVNYAGVKEEKAK